MWGRASSAWTGSTSTSTRRTLQVGAQVVTLLTQHQADPVAGGRSRCMTRPDLCLTARRTVAGRITVPVPTVLPVEHDFWRFYPLDRNAAAHKPETLLGPADATSLSFVTGAQGSRSADGDGQPSRPRTTLPSLPGQFSGASTPSRVKMHRTPIPASPRSPTLRVVVSPAALRQRFPTTCCPRRHSAVRRLRRPIGSGATDRSGGTLHSALRAAPACESWGPWVVH
jgi:hypothetical protein